jgi:hypothetical protein
MKSPKKGDPIQTEYGTGTIVSVNKIQIREMRDILRGVPAEDWRWVWHVVAVTVCKDGKKRSTDITIPLKTKAI